MKNPKQKNIIHIVPLLVILAIAGGAIWFFLNNGGVGARGTKVPINASQLMPFVSAKEARTTICNLKKEELFAQICQSKFDGVDKENIEKISELFAVIEKIKNDKSISDYERLLLAQAVFAALPIGDNPENPESRNYYQQSLLSRLKDYLTGQITVYAQRKAMSEEEFKDLMNKDLQNIVDSLPKGDNAWVINVMVSKYSWKDGKSQPLYSHQYAESFDPFPNNPNANPSDTNYHVQSVVGSKASSQTADVGGPVYKGTSDMIGYSFTIMSWKSQEYTRADGLPLEDKFMVQRRNRSDSFYQGEYYLNDLLDAVKMPSTRRPIENPDEPTDQMNTESKNVTCEEALKIIGKDRCPQYTIPHDPIKDDKNNTQYIGIWCFPDVGSTNLSEPEVRPPDYKMSVSEWKKCNRRID